MRLMLALDAAPFAEIQLKRLRPAFI